jgi:hypothetical protein
MQTFTRDQSEQTTSRSKDWFKAVPCSGHTKPPIAVFHWKAEVSHRQEWTVSEQRLMRLFFRCSVKNHQKYRLGQVRGDFEQGVTWGEKQNGSILNQNLGRSQ